MKSLATGMVVGCVGGFLGISHHDIVFWAIVIAIGLDVCEASK
jgi:hypothetical protein